MDIIEIDRHAVAFVPEVDPGLPPALHYAMTVSRSADLDIRCPHCGGPTMWKGHLEERPEVYERRMVLACRHGTDCPGDQARVLEAFQRWRQERE